MIRFNNIKFVPKTETRIILEQKEPSNLIKLASSLGVISTSYNCDEKLKGWKCNCEFEAAVKSAYEIMKKHGGTVMISTSANGSKSVTYTAP